MQMLDSEKIIDGFKAALGADFVDSRIYERKVGIRENIFKVLWVTIRKEAFRKAANYICGLQEYPHLTAISSRDLGDNIDLIYHFTIYYGHHLQELSLGLRVRLPKDDLRIPTITDIIPGALFAEREIQEMMGVEVIDIPDKRNLLLPEDFPKGIYPWRMDETGPHEMLKILPGRVKK